MKKIKLELPSGVSLQKKISNNLKHWSTDLILDIENGCDEKKTIEAYEYRIREQIKKLADKFYLILN